ncbi:MAG: hypothetical protein CAF41_003235 [Nitrospira sp. CG24A]|nr:MAG: hypothetical protein CAF41_003235 [Nitrospira sp. CG24A]
MKGEYAVWWFTLSLINAGLAQVKGRSGLGWRFGSLFFGPICTLLIVVLDLKSPQDPKEPGGPQGAEDMIRYVITSSTAHIFRASAE